MEQLAARSSAAMGPPPTVLRLRPLRRGGDGSGGDQGGLNDASPWSPPCMLVPGRHAAGEWKGLRGFANHSVEPCS